MAKKSGKRAAPKKDALEAMIPLLRLVIGLSAFMALPRERREKLIDEAVKKVERQRKKSVTKKAKGQQLRRRRDRISDQLGREGLHNDQIDD